MPVSLVFGGSGAIGRFLVPRLLAGGHEVIALSRQPRTSTKAGLRWIVGDLPTRVPPLPAVDVVLSVGPLDAFAQWFAASGAMQTRRIVAIGSLSAKTKKASADPLERDLAERLVRAEHALSETADARGCAVTVLRPTLIYGTGLDRSLTPIVAFARRWHVFPCVTGARGLRQPVHADDLAAACVAMAAAPSLPRRIYEVGGAERIAFSEMHRRVRDSLPFATILLPVPFVAARAGAGLARHLPAFRAASPSALRRMNEDLVADHAEAVADFDWSPRDFRPDARDWAPPPLS
jgi:nucleoside-diphosphate-sugar epimerase